jgi:glycerol-3-phosphate cytidylyltransferase-like family protein
MKLTLFSFSQVKYKVVLFVSALIFGLSYVGDIINQPERSETIYLVGYVLGVVIASFWGILNYIDHLRVNPLYKHTNTIHGFIDELELNSDDKLELKAYMEDYVNDQVAHGKDIKSATEEVINQFKVQEFTGNQLSKDTFFFQSHNYLMGNGLVLFLVGIVFWILFSQVHSVIFVGGGVLGVG